MADLLWAKHAFWMPNQFVDVNPVEYLNKRKKAFVSSLKYTNQNFHNLSQAQTIGELFSEEKKHTHAVFCGILKNNNSV